MAIRELIKAAIEAHGGKDRWGSLHAVDATLSAWGFLFTAKRRPVTIYVKAERKWRFQEMSCFWDGERRWAGVE